MNRDKQLQNIIFSMLIKSEYMFYGLFLAELNKGFDPDTPSACVGKHSNSPNIELRIGESFWDKVLTNESLKKGIIIHELNVKSGSLYSNVLCKMS